MSLHNAHKPCEQRFKGVENFLRRVAFNLGNTASQTEVKIISCIPIDVTDLQQKIISLEKQLLDTQKRTTNATVNEPDKLNNSEKVTEKVKSSEKPSTVVNTALYGTNFGKQLSDVSFSRKKSISRIKSGQNLAYCEECSFQAKRSIPTLSQAHGQHSCTISSQKVLDNGNMNTINRYKNIFKARKKNKTFGGKPKLKTHLIYYAQQTADNPFKSNDVPLNYHTSLSNTEEMCLSYLNNIIRRQYDPNEVVEEFSDTSNFSRPVCRETALKNTQYESDVCSCCHGTFQNIDNYMKNSLFCEPITEAHNKLSNSKIFYDSNNYDIIPVKEKVYNVKKDKKGMAKNNPKTNIKMKCWPEDIRTKQLGQTLTINYETKNPINHGHKAVKYKYKNVIPQKLNKNALRIINTEQQTGMETSKSFSIECGDTYPKMINNNMKPHVQPVKNTLKINESVETDEVFNKLQGINQSTQLELNLPEESTLNEIKTVLQSVLEEIKTSTKLNITNKTMKQDVDVQKGSSQKTLQGESVLLRSYTYNKSYNTNPNVASCSSPHGHYCYSSVPYQPMKFLQNFPVFIQPTSGRHTCACYHRKSSLKPDSKQAATVNKNTEDIKKCCSKETEKLIKEIYKSITLNLDYPTKDISSSEYNKPSSSENACLDKDEPKQEKASRRDIEIETKHSAFRLHENRSTLVYTAASTQSEDKSELDESHISNETNTPVNNYKTFRDAELQSIGTINEDKVSASSSETETDETVVIEGFKQNVKRKKGFFNRMLKSVKLFKKKKDIPKEYSDIDEASDSDDYETVYSENSKVTSRQNVEDNLKHKNQGNIRSPYLEQEYRRQWNEYLMFREQENSKHSSERPCSKQTISKSNKPVYWSNYEARRVMIDHGAPSNSYPTKISAEQNVKQQKPENEKLGWLKKHKLGIKCGEQWKKFILES